MSTLKFAMWVVWISILLTIGFIVLLPLALPLGLWCIRHEGAARAERHQLRQFIRVMIARLHGLYLVCHRLGTVADGLQFAVLLLECPVVGREDSYVEPTVRSRRRWPKSILKSGIDKTTRVVRQAI